MECALTSRIPLDEPSRRSHLTKSAILKYFESREATLLDRAWKQRTTDLGMRPASLAT
ncbi:hypothetical protein [Umezawaea sp. NPDC059074]|uniref:hypothetical protein n=1 Tax=Umezawaea sp. NPDC059074 TaxID=3346716 RepID=UPI0036B7AB2D